MFSFKKRRELLSDEKDLSYVLEILVRNNVRDIEIGNCGWAEFPNRWFISFNTNDDKFSKSMKDLTAIGEITIEVRPGGQIDNYFTKEGF